MQEVLLGHKNLCLLNKNYFIQLETILKLESIKTKTILKGIIIMLFNRNFFSIAILSGVLLLTTSCMDFSSEGGAAQDFSPITEKQDLFEKKLNQIVKKIDALQVSVNKINISNTAQNNKKDNKKDNKNQNKRKPADPNYAHSIPQGNSYFMGNPDAKVTITEFFDFQ